MSQQNKESFLKFSLNKQLLVTLEEEGITNPTAIQEKSFFSIENGQDVIGIAPTGTGKTLAYLLPLMRKLNYHRSLGPRVLIMAPTRELVHQINENVKTFGKKLGLTTLAIYGGVGLKEQTENLKLENDIIIATPGRLMDHYLKGNFNTKHLKHLVLDEADKLMDMGFMPQLRKLLEIIPVKRQNLLFSATFSEKVDQLSEEFLEDPIRIEVSPQATTAHTVEQCLYEVPNFRTKVALLEHIILANKDTQILVFVKTKKNATNIGKFLSRKVVDNVRVIHGNKSQNTRLNAINSFSSKEVQVLVSTDVSARGIDIKDIKIVINFDVPLMNDDYVHRIGRTGRAFKKGESITFANKAEMLSISEIESLIREKIPVRPLPENVAVYPTPKEEAIDIARSLDHHKRKIDPDFKGAFHEKKSRKSR